MFDRCIPIFKIKTDKNTEYSTKKIKSILSSPKNKKIIEKSFFVKEIFKKTEILGNFSFFPIRKITGNI